MRKWKCFSFWAVVEKHCKPSVERGFSLENQVVNITKRNVKEEDLVKGYGKVSLFSWWLPWYFTSLRKTQNYFVDLNLCTGPCRWEGLFKNIFNTYFHLPVFTVLRLLILTIFIIIISGILISFWGIPLFKTFNNISFIWDF